MKRILLATLLLTAMPLMAQRIDLQHTWSSPMKLYVVLVKFKDVSENHDKDKHGHSEHDTPYGWSKNSDGEWEPGDDAYTLEDFQKLFGESGAPSFKGTGITVADGNEDLPEVFGSVKDYYDEMSGGDLDLQVEVVNDPMDDHEEYPEWIELPRSRWYYEVEEGEYWEHCYLAAVAAGHTLPRGNTIANRKANKILFLHAGTEIADRGQLHPRVEKITTTDPSSTDVMKYGYRYVMAERRGSGNPGHTDVDAFAAIGLHVHEIGHLLGLNHYRGGYPPTLNPYTGTTATTLGTDDGIQYHGNWSIMASNQHGPPIWKQHTTTEDYDEFVYAYGSCPVHFDAVYRKWLGWSGGEVLITETVQDRTIDPGPDNYYRIRSMDHPTLPSEFFLDLVTAEEYGQYIGWHRFEKMVGLLVWKEVLEEDHVGRSLYIDYPRVIWDDPRLIPADGRWIRDARETQSDETPIGASLVSGTDVPVVEDDSDYTYTWQDQISDPFGFIEGVASTLRRLPEKRDPHSGHECIFGCNDLRPNPERGPGWKIRRICARA